MTKILVTGAEGFIGHWLCKSLEFAHSVIRVDNRLWCSHQHEATHRVDIRSEEIAELIASADVVVHLAAQINIDRSNRYILDTIDHNVVGSTKIIQQCLKQNIPLVVASSSEIYGSSDRAISEDHPLNGQSPYAASKIAMDRLCYAITSTWPDWRCTIVRPFNTYGPGQRYDSYGGVIAKFIKAALAGEPLTIYGDGLQCRDYTYVTDIVKGFEMAIEGRLPNVVNLASGRTYRVLDIANEIVRLTGTNAKVVHTDPRPGEVRCLIGNAGLAEAHGWKWSIPFYEGLKRCVDYALKGDLPEELHHDTG